jgi:outer membrane protein assembly factor BamB
VVSAAAVVGLAVAVAVAGRSLDLGHELGRALDATAATDRDSLALELPGPAEVADPATRGDAPATDGGGPGAASSTGRDTPAVGVRAVPSRCLDGGACRVWEVGLPAGTDAGAIVTAAGAVVVPSVREVRTYDLRTGELRWTAGVRAAGNRVVAPRAALAGGVVLVAGADERLHAYQLHDGTRRWSAEVADLEQVVDAREVAGRLLVAGRRSAQRASRGVILAVDPADGTVDWRVDVGGVLLTDVGAVSYDRGAGLRGHDPSSGAVRWSAAHDARLGDLRAVGPYVLVAAADDRLLLDATTGRDVARVPRAPLLGPLPTEAATVVPGEDRALLVDRDGLVWEAPVAGGCCTGHLVTDDTVTLRRTDGSLLVLDRIDGALLMERDPLTGDGVEVSGWLLGGLEFTAAGDADDAGPRLRVRDLGSGRLLDELPAVTPVAVVGRDVLVASADRLVRLSPTPGRVGPTGSLRTQ